MADEDDKVLAGESSPDQEAQQETAEKSEQNQRVRNAIGDVYTFVRSREINETLSSFPFDHYIQEAMEDIRGTLFTLDSSASTGGNIGPSLPGRAVRDAAGHNVARRPAKLQALEELKSKFMDMWDAAKELAEKADTDDA